MYSVKLADGTELNNLELNGNNYISETVIDDEVFKDNLDTVSIIGEDGVSEYKNMKLVQNQVYGTQSWFILTEKTQSEIEKEELGQELSEREIQEILQGQQLSDLDIRLLMGGL